MGLKGREILGEHADEVIGLLRKAYADEWLAYYQYWVGSKVVKGPMKDGLIAELVEHAADELRHAEMLTDRLAQIGGEPILNPQEWFKLTNCGYDAPEDAYIRTVLEQNIKGERCAISVYNELLKKTKDFDPVTYNIALQILQDEVEHEEDLQALLEDLNEMLAREKR